MIKLTVVGAGLMGRSLAMATRGSDWARVVYVCDPDEQNGRALAKELNATWSADSDAALADERIDAVVVAIPQARHPAVVTAALEAGRHVLCEKPLALTTAACRDMIRLARRVDRKLMVGHILRFDDAARLLHDLVNSSEFGEPRAAVVHRSERGWEWGGWRHQRSMHGGLFFETGVHEIDLLLRILGTPTRVCAECGGVPDHGMESLAAALLTFEGGRFATLRYGVEDPWGEHLIEVHCERAVVRMVRSEKPLGLSIWRSGSDKPEFIPTERGHLSVREMKAFCAALAEDRPIPVPAEDGLAAVAVAEAIVKSCETHAVVPLSAEDLLP